MLGRETQEKNEKAVFNLIPSDQEGWIHTYGSSESLPGIGLAVERAKSGPDIPRWLPPTQVAPMQSWVCFKVKVA